MKRNFFAITLLFSCVILVGCTSEKKEDLSFDVDLNSLAYQLPKHDKVCIPDSSMECTVDGCKRIKPSVFVLFDKKRNLTYRCDKKPCDVYEVNATPSGIFTYIQPKDAKDLTLKIADDPSVDLLSPDLKNKYREVVGLMLDTIISTGKCVDVEKNEPEELDVEDLKKMAFSVIDSKNQDGWDEKVQISEINETQTAVKGYWWKWDKWSWIGYLDNDGTWKILVNMDGFDCDEVDKIPSNYNVFFRDEIYFDKVTRYCY